jgi:hypothetical protein
MRRGELAWPAARPAEALQMAAVSGEAVDHSVAVTVGNIDFAVPGDRDIGRMVERRIRARPVALAEGPLQLAPRAHDQDLMSVPVDQEQAVIRRDRDPMSVVDQAGGEAGAIGSG